jgi:hypothetical protein
MPKVTKSIRIDDELWKKVKIYVAKNETDISSFMEEVIKGKLKG